MERALGNGIKRPVPSEIDVRAVVRRSIVAARDLPAGTVLRQEDLAIKRPGTGIPPSRLSWLLGRTLISAVSTDELLTEEIVQ